MHFVKQSLEILKEKVLVAKNSPLINLLMENQTELKGINSCIELVKYISELEFTKQKIIPRIDPQSDDVCKDFIFRQFLIQRFFVMYIQNVSTIDFDSKIFDLAYNEMDIYLTDNVKNIYRAPLYNISFEGESFSFGEFVIRKMTPSDYSDIFRIEKDKFRESPFIFGIPPEYVIQIDSSETYIGVIRDKMQELVYMLSLVIQKPVQMLVINCKYSKFSPFELGMATEIVQPRGRKLSHIMVRKRDIDIFSKFFTNFRSGLPIEIRIATKRYCYSIESHIFEDIILDLMIALETLYGNKGDKGEITHKISTRICLFLGQNECDTECLRQFIKGIYDIRSRLVHEGRYDPNRYKWTESYITKKLQEITRKSIITFIQLKNLPNLGFKKEDLDSLISNPTLRHEVLQKIQS